MRCSVCGFELKEDEKFCSNCGTIFGNVEEAPVVPSKKKSKLPTILIAIAAVLVVLVGCFFIFKDALTGKMAFLLPAEKQLKAAFKEASEDWSEKSAEFVTDVSAVEVSEAGTLSGEISVAIGSAAKKELQKETDVDLGDISKVYVQYEGRFNESKLFYDLSVGLGKTSIMTVECVMDMEEELVSLTIPELSDKAIEFEMENDLDLDMDEIALAMEQSNEVRKIMKDILPSEELLKDMIPRYIAVMIQSIDEAEREKDVVEIGDVSQKATALTVEIDDKLLKNVKKAFMKELEEDEAFEKYLKGAAKAIADLQDENISKSEWKEFYDDMLDGIEEMFESMEEQEAFEKGVEVVTWVNSKNEIIGIEIEDVIDIMSVRDGNNVAKQIQLMEEGSKEKLMRILVEGQEEEEVFSGDVTLYVEGEKVFDTQIEKYQWTDETFDLVASFDVTEEMLEAAAMENPYGDITLKVEVSSTKQSANIALKGLIKGKEWIVLECSGKEKSGKTEIKYPSDVIGVDDISEWIETVDVEEIVDNLDEAGVLDLLNVEKEDLITLLEQYVDYYMGNSYYDDYYYDYY